jgi:hypothetical protein
MFLYMDLGHNYRFKAITGRMIYSPPKRMLISCGQDGDKSSGSALREMPADHPASHHPEAPSPHKTQVEIVKKPACSLTVSISNTISIHYHITVASAQLYLIQQLASFDVT